MHASRIFFITGIFLLSSFGLSAQKPRMTPVIPDSIKKLTADLILKFIPRSRFDSCITFNAKESWGAGFLSQVKKDTSWSYEVWYQYAVPGDPRAIYNFYFNVIEGRITNSQNPFPACFSQPGALHVVSLDKARDVLFGYDKNYRVNWEKVTYRLVKGDCLNWTFSYRDEPKKNGATAPSSSAFHSISINAITGEVLKTATGNN
jgi:hypothetical protein